MIKKLILKLINKLLLKYMIKNNCVVRFEEKGSKYVVRAFSDKYYEALVESFENRDK